MMTSFAGAVAQGVLLAVALAYFGLVASTHWVQVAILGIAVACVGQVVDTLFKWTAIVALVLVPTSALLVAVVFVFSSDEAVRTRISEPVTHGLQALSGPLSRLLSKWPPV